MIVLTAVRSTAVEELLGWMALGRVLKTAGPGSMGQQADSKELGSTGLGSTGMQEPVTRARPLKAC